MKASEYSILRYSKVTFVTEDRRYVVSPEFIVSYQINFTASTMKLTGNLLVDDAGIINSLIDIKDQHVLIEYTDFLGHSTSKVFKVIAQQHINYGNDQKGYDMYLQDYPTYALENSYLGKSFPQGTNMADIINEYLDYFEIPPIVDGILHIDKNLVVPKHINNLRFFEEEIFRMGATIYNTRDGFKIITTEEMYYEAMQEEAPFVQDTDNRDYRNAIIEVRFNELTRDQNEPKFVTFEFDYNTKTFLYNDYNELEKFSDSDDDEHTSPQETVGFFPVYDRMTSHEERLRRNTLKNYGLEILVNGYAYRELHKIQVVTLKTTNMTSTQSMLGDVVNSGRYVIQQIQDRIIGESLMQKLFLRRATQNKVLDIQDIISTDNTEPVQED